MENKTYSSFWPLQILVLGLGISVGYQLFQLNSERVLAVNYATGDQMQAGLKDMVTLHNKCQNFATDLLQVAKTDPIAAQLINEFHIQDNSSAQPAKK